MDTVSTTPSACEFAVEAGEPTTSLHRIRRPSPSAGPGRPLPAGPGGAGPAEGDSCRATASAPVVRMLSGYPPRAVGADEARVLRPSAPEGPRPPFPPDRRAGRGTDGIRRLPVVFLRGRRDADAECSGGTSEGAGPEAADAGAEHGRSPTPADRAAAALRILTTYPTMSDRAIAVSVGLGARAVAELRRSSDAVPKANFRIGRDGKVRPLNGAGGRLRAAELMKENPGASLRQVARTAGVSPATALDVRRRLERGAEPVPRRRPVGYRQETAAGSRSAGAGNPSAAALGKLTRDPSLRQSELGRQLLRLLGETEVGTRDLAEVVASVPAHCIELIVEVARQNSRVWEGFAENLERRARFVNAE